MIAHVATIEEPTMNCRFLLSLLLLSFVTSPAAAADAPDPLSVRWQGPAYRYPQNGWAVLHIEGEPYDRGYQHGCLMAREIENYIAALSEHRATKSPAEYWDLYRELVGSLYLRRFDREYLEEMKGIAEGAAAAGAKASGRPLDLTDIAGVNLWVELACLGDALRATPSGLEGVKGSKPAAAYPPLPQEHHCSAFAATGPATADGKIVFGHITMWNIHQASHFFVWLDVKPAKGHRIIMQTFPGGIYSGMDYYISSSGLMLTETTLDQTRFDPDGTPLATRARKALQYASTIDELAKELMVRNNGLYTNEWLIGDANTNEIAVLELGTTKHRFRRSSKNEWLIPGVEGFYWGCNNAKDLGVRLETMATLDGKPEDVSWRPTDRDLGWLKMYREHKGKIDVNFGKLAYSGPPLAKLHSLDAKVTNTALAKQLQAHALFGPPYGRVWEPEPWQKAKYKIIPPLVPNEWSLMTTACPSQTKVVCHDLVAHPPQSTEPTPPTFPAWHGTLLPKTDADVWLTAGFAHCERLVALEDALTRRHAGRLSAGDHEALDLARFGEQTGYLSAKVARPKWRTGTGENPPNPLDAQLDRARWHREQASHGALTLLALRSFVGDAPFAAALDSFGLANAGKEVTVPQFVHSLQERTGKDVAAWLNAWLKDPKIVGPVYSTSHWLEEPESAIIVYGTAGDKATNSEAATALQAAVRVSIAYGRNVIVPVRADTDVNDIDLRDRHVVLVGRPSTNALAKRFASAFPVTFGPSSVKVGSESFAHEGTAIVAAGTNPLSPRYSVVLLAGLSADATYRTAKSGQFPLAEVSLYFQDGGARHLAVTPRHHAVSSPSPPLGKGG
jgi:Phospholipase B